MAEAIRQQHVALARTLHPRLIRFFTKFPPLVPQTAISLSSSTDADPPTAPLPDTKGMTWAEKREALNTALPYHNPFMPRKNHATGKWSGPRYGLRIQADLCKLARANGVEELMPFSLKRSDIRLQKRLESGVRVKGTGEGERVKGKIWERQLKPKLEKRRQAMLKMPEMIEEWRQVSLQFPRRCLHTNSITEGPRPRVEEMAKVAIYRD